MIEINIERKSQRPLSLSICFGILWITRRAAFISGSWLAQLVNRFSFSFIDVVADRIASRCRTQLDHKSCFRAGFVFSVLVAVSATHTQRLARPRAQSSRFGNSNNYRTNNLLLRKKCQKICVRERRKTKQAIILSLRCHCWVLFVRLGLVGIFFA